MSAPSQREKPTGRRGSLRGTWGWLGMWHSCVIRSYLLEMPEKSKRPLSHQLLFLALSAETTPTPLPQTHATAAHSPPPTVHVWGPCSSDVLSGHSRARLSLPHKHGWRSVRLGSTEANGYMKRANALRLWVGGSPFFLLSQLKKQMCVKGSIRFQLPFVGSTPEGHSTATCQMWVGRRIGRRTMEKGTSNFLSIYCLAHPNTQICARHRADKYSSNNCWHSWITFRALG